MMILQGRFHLAPILFSWHIIGNTRLNIGIKVNSCAMISQIRVLGEGMLHFMQMFKNSESHHLLGVRRIISYNKLIVQENNISRSS